MDVVRAIGLVNRALLFGHVLHALANQGFGLRVQRQFQPEGARRALAGVVVWRGANAAAGKHDIARGKRTLQGGGDAVRRIADVIGVIELQAACLQQLDDLGQVLVSTLAREDLVADDDQAEAGGGARLGIWRDG